MKSTFLLLFTIKQRYNVCTIGKVGLAPHQEAGTTRPAARCGHCTLAGCQCGALETRLVRRGRDGALTGGQSATGLGVLTGKREVFWSAEVKLSSKRVSFWVNVFPNGLR